MSIPTNVLETLERDDLDPELVKLLDAQTAAEQRYRDVYFANCDYRNAEGRRIPDDHPDVAEAGRAQSAAQEAVARYYLGED